MAERRVVAPAGLGEPIGPFVRGIAAGGLVAISGTSALSHLSGPANERKLVPDFEAQARQTFANLETALEAAGLGWRHAVQMTVILTRREDRAAFEAIRAEALGDTPVAGTPLASTVAVARLLRAEMLIEVDLWAVQPGGGAVVGRAGTGGGAVIEKRRVTGLAGGAGPFAGGVRAGRLVVFSATGADSHLAGPAESRELPPSFEAQARQSFANLEAALAAAGLGWRDAIKMTVVLKSRENYAQLNSIRAELFADEPIASTTFIAELPRAEALIEVDLWALAPDDGAPDDAAPGAG